MENHFYEDPTLTCKFNSANQNFINQTGKLIKPSGIPAQHEQIKVNCSKIKLMILTWRKNLILYRITNIWI